MSHRVASINGVTIGPGQRAFFLMAGTGFGQQAMWQLLTTLNGRLPVDEGQFQHVIEQMRRYGHMVESNLHGNPRQGQYMPTGLDLQHIHENPWDSAVSHLPTGPTTSIGAGGGGAHGASPA